jgi:hypothetical protein
MIESEILNGRVCYGRFGAYPSLGGNEGGSLRLELRGSRRNAQTSVAVEPIIAAIPVQAAANAVPSNAN